MQTFPETEVDSMAIKDPVLSCDLVILKYPILAWCKYTVMSALRDFR